MFRSSSMSSATLRQQHAFGPLPGHVLFNRLGRSLFTFLCGYSTTSVFFLFARILVPTDGSVGRHSSSRVTCSRYLSPHNKPCLPPGHQCFRFTQHSDVMSPEAARRQFFCPPPPDGRALSARAVSLCRRHSFSSLSSPFPLPLSGVEYSACAGALRAHLAHLAHGAVLPYLRFIPLGRNVRNGVRRALDSLHLILAPHSATRNEPAAPRVKAWECMIISPDGSRRPI